MPITRIQQAHAINSAIITLSSTASGSLIVVMAEMVTGGGGVINSIIDNKSNFYAQVPGVQAVDTTDGIATDIWYSKNSIAGVTTITVNYTGVSSNITTAAEYSGVNTVSPLDSGAKLDNQNAPPAGPSIIVSTGELIVAILGGVPGITSVQSPWSDVFVPGGGIEGAFADIVTGSSGSFSAVWNPTTSHHFCSSSASFLLPTPALTLFLSDSISSSDSTTKEDDKSLSDSVMPSDVLALARAQNVSDSIAVKDSFSLQSNFIAPNPIPSVETLTNSVIPAEVKTFYKFQ